MRKIIIRILFLSLLLQKSYAYQIDTIPFEDKQKLERLFKFLMTRTSIGYTLCGEKPCSIYNNPMLIKIPSAYSVKIFFKYAPYSFVMEGWKTWKKYETQFPSKVFIFRYAPEYGALIFINKPATRKMIQDNLDLFQKYSKSQSSADEFLKEVCQPTGKDYLMNQNIALLGILLGYGRNNSLAFSQRSHVQNLKKFNLYESYSHLSAISDPGFMTIQNGTNEEENLRIRQMLKEAKRNIKANFGSERYLENFIRIFNQ